MIALDFKIGDILSEWEIVQFVKNIHYNKMDFCEGDLRENIEKNNSYELKEVLVNDLEEPCYYVDEELVQDYKNENINTMPPIIVDFYVDNTYRTIDGGHRVTVAKELKLKKIKAFVALK